MLRPASLDELGLEAAVESLAERTASTEGLAVDLDLTLGDERLPRELESALYRLVQEALTNVGKHARAEHVQLRLLEADGTITLEVTDNGQGFDPLKGTAGYGLVGMRERVELLSGTLDIDSRPAGGTTIRAVCHVPLGASAWRLCPWARPRWPALPRPP